MGCAIGQNSLFGGANNYIKFQGGDLIAIEGPNTVERQMLSDLRFNYKQLLRGRIILKPGQVNYLMNHLGLGDNATFVSLAARYDAKSKIEEDNYINWSFYDDLTKIYPMSNYMCLTGNSTNRVKQLYLTNPNATYPVTIDVMVAVLDDSYNFFTDVVNQTGTSFVNLRFTDLRSYVVGESIKLLDSQGRELIYIILNNINSIEISGKVIIIDDDSLGRLFFQFVSEYDARQANSILNMVLDNPLINIDDLTSDDTPPVIYWYSNVNNSPTASIISLGGQVDGRPYNSTDGLTFSTTINLLEFGNQDNVITKSGLINLLIDKVVDNRDGTMSIVGSNILLTGTQGSVDQLSFGGNYKMKFQLSDLAGNDLQNVEMSLSVIDYDTRPPVVYWYSNVNNDVTQPYIEFMGDSAGVPYNSEIGTTFSTYVLFSEFSQGGEITKQKLIDILIDKVIDYNDGEIPVYDFNVILLDSNGNDVFTIFETGDYTLTFNISDQAENTLYNKVILDLHVVNQLPDTNPPVVYFFGTVGELPNTSLITLYGGVNPYGYPLNTSQADVFETYMTFSNFAQDSVIDKTNLINNLIDYVLDEVEGPITLTEENITLSVNNQDISYISGPGLYTMKFNLEDGIGNNLQDKIVYLYVESDAAFFD